MANGPTNLPKNKITITKGSLRASYKPNIMKNYQLNIIKEYVSTALISVDAEQTLVEGICELIDLSGNNSEEILEYLFEAEKRIQIVP